MFSTEVAKWEAKISAMASRSSCSDLASASHQVFRNTWTPSGCASQQSHSNLRSKSPFAMPRACSALTCLSAAFAAFRSASSWLVFASCGKPPSSVVDSP